MKSFTLENAMLESAKPMQGIRQVNNRQGK